MIAWIDWKTKHIPDKYVLGVFVSGVVGICLMPEISLIQRVMGIFIVSMPLLILACIVPGSIGGGDVKLMAAGGMLLGSTGIWNAFVMGVVSAGIYVVILLMNQKAGRKSEIALGPFLCIGMFLVFVSI